jgi:hypothetical protein
MSLNYVLDKIEDYENLCWEPTGEVDSNGDELVRINSKTEAIIFATMALGINKITEKNLVEWATRCKLAAGVGYLSKKITVEDLRAHIGLSTNASPLTAAKFRANLYKQVESDSKREMGRFVNA